MSTAILPFAQAQLTYYGATTLLILGVIGNICIVLIFNQHNRNACSMYLMGAAVMNIISLTFAIPQNIYSSAYGDLKIRSLIYCRIRNYLGNVWGQMARFFIVLACIDRYTLTSENVNIRALSRPLIARWSMIIGTIIWHILNVHILVLFKIENGRCTATGLYYIIYSIYYVVVVWFIPCLGIAVFGFSAYSNLRKLHARVVPLENAVANGRPNGIIHHRDRDLFVMVLSESVAYIALMIFYPGITLEASITNYIGKNKSLAQIQMESFIMTIALFFMNATNAMPFYVYFITSKAFRNDFKKLLTTCWRKVKGQAVTIVNHNTV